MTTFAGLYGPETIFDRAGRPLRLANVVVLAADGVTPAVLYTSRTKAVTTPSNTVQTTSDGNLSFFADPGAYRLRWTVAGVTHILDVEVPQDFEDQGGAVLSVNGRTGVVTLAAADVGAVPQSAVGVSVAQLVGGKVPSGQIPGLSWVRSHAVANQAAMLALTGVVAGEDLALRQDGAGTFLLTGADPSQLGSWTLLPSPTDAVVSVNGRTGAVVLAAADVGADAAGAATAVQGNLTTHTSNTSNPHATTAAQAGAPNVVVHGATAGTARPAGATLVLWIGSVAPSNAATNDWWWDTSVELSKRWSGSAWKASGAGTYLMGRTGVYVPSDWGKFWKPKRNAALTGAGKAVVALAGDSVTRGYYASSLAAGWGGLLGADLRGANGSSSDGGSGFQSMADTSVYMQNRGLTAPQAAFWGSAGTNEFIVLTGSWAADAVGAAWALDGPGAGYLKGSSAATATAIVRGTTVKVYGIVPVSGQSITITIDGADNTFNLPASGMWTATYSGLAAGNHTVKVTCTTVNANSIYLSGFAGENAAGFVVNNFGIASARSITLANLTGAQTGITTLPGSGTFGSAGGWTGGPSYPADLVIYGMGLNDLAASVAIDTYTGYVERFLDGVKGAAASGPHGDTDLIIFVPAWGKFDTPAFGAQYAQRLRGLAEHYGAAIVNCNPALVNNSYVGGADVSYWSGGAAAPGTVGADNGHPSDQGHALMKTLIETVVNLA